MTLRDLFEFGPLQPRNLVPAVVAVVVAIAAWFGIQRFAIEAEPPPERAPAAAGAETPPPPLPEAAPPPAYPTVLVAKRDLRSGVLLVSELVDWREWREPLDLNLAIVQDAVPLQAVLGAVTTRPYKGGTMIAWDGLITPGGPGFIGAVLRPGMRAVTVEVDRATTAANIIYPGDRVDVIMVSIAGNGVSAEADALGVAAQSIVHDVRVLAVGSTIVALGRYGRVSLTRAGGIEPPTPPEGDNYTLEVLPVDAERIALAAAAGRLTLAMRSVAAQPGYDDEQRTLPVGFGEVMTLPPPPVSDLPEIPAAPAVRILRGTVSTEAASADL